MHNTYAKEKEFAAKPNTPSKEDIISPVCRESNCGSCFLQVFENWLLSQIFYRVAGETELESHRGGAGDDVDAVT